jgi:membrane protein DedA with SNARE-associated domain
LIPIDQAFFRDLAIFFGMFIGAGLGLPFPEEILIVLAGIWTAANHHYGVFRWLMLPVCLVGVIIADVFLYTIGRVFGSRVLDARWIRWMVPPHKRDRIEKNFHQYGVGILLFGRLLPGVRAPLFLTAGTLRLPIPRFIVADAIGAILGNSILYFLAFWFGDSLKDWLNQIKNQVDNSRPLVVMFVIAGIGIYLLIHFWNKPVTEGDPKELPIIGQTIAEHMSQDVKVKKETAAADAAGAEPSLNGEAARSAEKETRAPPAEPPA